MVLVLLDFLGMLHAIFVELRFKGIVVRGRLIGTLGCRVGLKVWQGQGEDELVELCFELLVP